MKKLPAPIVRMKLAHAGPSTWVLFTAGERSILVPGQSGDLPFVEVPMSPGRPRPLPVGGVPIGFVTNDAGVWLLILASEHACEVIAWPPDERRWTIPLSVPRSAAWNEPMFAVAADTVVSARDAGSQVEPLCATIPSGPPDGWPTELGLRPAADALEGSGAPVWIGVAASGARILAVGAGTRALSVERPSGRAQAVDFKPDGHPLTGALSPSGRWGIVFAQKMLVLDLTERAGQATQRVSTVDLDAPSGGFLEDGRHALVASAAGLSVMELGEEVGPPTLIVRWGKSTSASRSLRVSPSGRLAVLVGDDALEVFATSQLWPPPHLRSLPHEAPDPAWYPGADMSETPENELEGLDGGGAAGAVSYPIDAVHVRDEKRTVFEVVRRINQGQYVMDPDFQRDFVWSLEQQSRLIESVLMRIPLPVLYLAENADGKLVVVDGLQRLTTFKRFLAGEFKLALPHAPDLHDRDFDGLPAQLKNRIEDAQLVLYVIDFKVPEQARLDIFERVNSGVPLSRQQMRNCLYVGQGTRWLREAADSPLFREVTGDSLDSKSMRDREVVNRFCSFLLLGPDAHTGLMDDFLAKGIKRMNALPTQDLEGLRARFDRSLRNNRDLFGKHAFRKHGPSGAGRNPFNVALFDPFSVLLADRDEALVQAHADRVRTGFYRLMDDKSFLSAISTATNSPDRVRTRFDGVRAMLSEALDAD
jgi:hypothetical protein